MRTVHVKGLPALRAAIQADLKRVGREAKAAARKTADLGRVIVYARAPIAFGDLRGSLRDVETAKGARIVADAPHACALEVGSRPHMPPLAPLVAWVKLRGMQGLNAAPGARGQAASIAGAIRSRGSSRRTPVDAPTQVAWAIALAISKNGTRPRWFMRSSLPELRALLHGYMTQHIKRS